MATRETRQDLVRAAVGRLGEWVAGLRWSDVPAEVRERVLTVLVDAVAVTALGSVTRFR